MLTVEVRIDGLVETRSILKRVERVINDMKPALTSAGKYLLQVFSVEAFESEGAIYGRRWPTLNPAYSLWKSQNYPGRGILERTGELRRGFRLTIGANFAQIRNNVSRGRFHQAGRGVPQRIIVALEKRQRDGVQQRIQKDVLDRLRAAA